MTDGSEKPKLWTAGDWNAYFGFRTNIVVNLIVLTGQLRFVVKVPVAIGFGRILPATGLMRGRGALARLGLSSSHQAAAAVSMFVAIIATNQKVSVAGDLPVIR